MQINLKECCGNLQPAFHIKKRKRNRRPDDVLKKIERPKHVFYCYKT